MGEWFRYLPRRWEVVTRMITGVLHGDAQAMGLRGIGNKPSEIELACGLTKSVSTPNWSRTRKEALPLFLHESQDRGEAVG